MRLRWPRLQLDPGDGHRMEALEEIDHVVTPRVGQFGAEHAIGELVVNHVGVRRRRVHCVDADAAITKFYRKAAHHADDSMLARRVVREVRWSLDAAVGRTGNDDRSTSGLLQHARNGCLHRVPHAREVDVDDFLPDLSGHFLDRRPAGDAGVGHDDVDATE